MPLTRSFTVTAVYGLFAVFSAHAVRLGSRAGPRFHALRVRRVTHVTATLSHRFVPHAPHGSLTHYRTHTPVTGLRTHVVAFVISRYVRCLFTIPIITAFTHLIYVLRFDLYGGCPAFDLHHYAHHGSVVCTCGSVLPTGSHTLHTATACCPDFYVWLPLDYAFTPGL